MRHRILLPVLGCVAVVSVPIQADSDFLFIPALAYQQKELKFDQRYSGADSNQADFSVSLPVISAGFTTVYERFFVALKYETNLSDTPTSTNETDRSQNLQFNLMAVDGSQINVGREDLSLTFGVSVWQNLNLFIGYLDGKTEVTPHPFCADPGQQPGLICTRVNRAFQQFFLGDNGFVQNQPEYVQTYSEQGPFIGASYAFQVNASNSLSMSLAYAQMDGQFEDNANDPENAFQDENGVANFVAFDYQGDSTGTSIAATWTGILGERTNYFIDLRRQSYSMEARDATGLPNYEGIQLDTDETMTSISLGISMYFD